MQDDKKPIELHVQTNVGFDAYDATTDKTYYATANVVAALSKVIHSWLTQKGLAAPDILDLQEDLFLNWSRRIKLGVGATVRPSVRAS